jgi:hypothetical protein
MSAATASRKSETFSAKSSNWASHVSGDCSSGKGAGDGAPSRSGASDGSIPSIGARGDVGAVVARRRAGMILERRGLRGRVRERAQKRDNRAASSLETLLVYALQINLWSSPLVIVVVGVRARF